MTAETDLLPLPAIDALVKYVEDYARANVEHHTKALRAEVEQWKRAAARNMQAWNGEVKRACTAEARVERLQAKVERLTSETDRLQQEYDERTACVIVHRGAALACSDAVRSAYSDEHHRAERLAEALRNSANALERLAFAIRAPNAHTPQLVELAIAMRAAARADQPAFVRCGDGTYRAFKGGGDD